MSATATTTAFPYRFLAFEGVEGSGKSTQVRLLADRLRALGLDVVTTFEPGATAVGRILREVVLGSHESMTPLTELFVFCADRAEHVAEVLRPALDAGSVVLTDRYELSTWAYQGVAGEIGPYLVDRMNEIATGGLHPDMTIVLDLDPAAGLARNRRDDDPDRMESKALAFHKRVRDAYLTWASGNPATSIVVDASQPADAVHAAILAALGIPPE
jgi:dTMP kinase